MNKNVIVQKKPFSKRLKKQLQKNWILYLMVLPIVIYFINFNYRPIYGVLIAFKDFNPKLGILKSPWAGFGNFTRFFSLYNFWRLVGNTFTLSLYSTLVCFPLTIVFALSLHYLTNHKLKKVVQMASYAPHFISTVVLCGMIALFTDKDAGVINIILNRVFGMEPVEFLTVPEYFKHIYVWSGLWKGIGFGAIIYISALAGVDPEMHEAAIMDGATKVQRMIHIDIPSIKPTIIMLLILDLGDSASVGFEKAFLLQNALNMSTSEIIATYTYRVGLIGAQYEYSAAVGLVNTVVNLIFLITANTICKIVTKESLF